MFSFWLTLCYNSLLTHGFKFKLTGTPYITSHYLCRSPSKSESRCLGARGVESTCAAQLLNNNINNSSSSSSSSSSQSLPLALAPCSTCSSGHRQISFDRVAKKEAEAIWGGARFCLGFGYQLYPSRVHRDLFSPMKNIDLRGHLSSVDRDLFFYEISEAGHRFKKKRLFSGAFLEPRV